MSIGGVGAAGSAYLGQSLSALLSQLSATQATSSTLIATTGSASAALPGCSTSNALTGSSTPSLSSEILGVLIGMQQQSGSTGSATAGSTSDSNPLQQLFSAMDTDGNGSISQTEMENYIEQQGGTQAQADQLYANIDQNGQSQGSTGGVTETELAQAAGPPPGGGAHGHHHHHHGMGSADQLAANPMQTTDSDNDGNTSQDEFAQTIGNPQGQQSSSSQASTILDTLAQDISGALA